MEPRLKVSSDRLVKPGIEPATPGLQGNTRLKVLSDRLVKPGIEPATPGLQGKRFIHYTTAPTDCDVVLFTKVININSNYLQVLFHASCF